MSGLYFASVLTKRKPTIRGLRVLSDEVDPGFSATVFDFFFPERNPPCNFRRNTFVLGARKRRARRWMVIAADIDALPDGFRARFRNVCGCPKISSQDSPLPAVWVWLSEISSRISQCCRPLNLTPWEIFNLLQHIYTYIYKNTTNLWEKTNGCFAVDSGAT